MELEEILDLGKATSYTGSDIEKARAAAEQLAESRA
jgi:hypothetical protein